MKIKTVFLLSCILPILLQLSACGLIRYKQVKSELAYAETYCESLMADKELDIIKNKLPLLSLNDATFDMLSNAEKVSDIEKPAIRIYANKKLDCQSAYFKVYEKHANQNELIILRGYREINNGLTADLYNQQLSYGEYIRKAKKVLVEQDSSLAKADAEAAAVAQEAYRTYLMNQQTQNQRQIINNMNKPVTCNRVGNYTYCN